MDRKQGEVALGKVLYTVGQIERYSFVDGKDSLTGRDILGEFFERIQRDGFKQTKGQFFTPPTVVRFMLYAVRLDDMAINGLNDRQNLPYIIDPSCGSGTFLIEAMRMITNEVKRRRRRELLSNRTVERRFEELFTPDNHEHRWARSHIYGVEHNFDLATASKVNMILHGDGASNIFHQDGLKPFRYFGTGNGDRLGNAVPSAAYGKRDVNERFDVVISNPPFSVELDGDTKKMLGASFAFGSKRNSENLFLERYFQLLTPGGRMAVVLPESVFDTTENKYIRLFLFWYFRVVAVVSLPQLAFAPYTQTKTSIMFAQKKTPKEVEAWATAWQTAASTYGKLRTRALNYIRVFVDGEAQSRFPSIATDDEAKVRQTISAFLRLEPDPATPAETLSEFIGRNQVIIDEQAECDAEPNSMFGACNTAWVFATVAAQHDQEIFAAEVAQVGYKRSKRGVQVQPNELYSVEIAPAMLDLPAVKAVLSERVERARREVSALEARLAKPKSSRGNIKAAPEASEEDSQDTNLHKRLGRAEADLVEAEVAERSMKEAVSRFFDKAGLLLPEHMDRTDPDLLRLFGRPEMRPFRSNEVIVSRATPVTVLEKMRAATLW